MGAQKDKHIGIIGLGLVGQALAKRLIQAGYSVYGYDFAEAARINADKLGVEVLSDAQQVVFKTKILMLSLLTSENRRELCWGSQALAMALQPETLILDTTTGRPKDFLEDHDRLSTLNVKLVDVCLSGSSHVISEGRALALVGDRKISASYADILGTFSKAQYYFDKPGQGNQVKLIINLVFGLNRLVLAEALGLAAKGGFDLGQILEILKEGETYSVAMDTKGPKMVAGVYEPAVARLGQHAKDVHLILEYANAMGTSLPLSETHMHLIQELVDAGHGDLDNAAIFKAYCP